MQKHSLKCRIVAAAAADDDSTDYVDYDYDTY
jgi:hypothetical protein